MKTLTSSLLIAAGLLGQAPAPFPAPQQPDESVKPEDKCSVEGTVVNLLTGEPLKKAHVSLQPGDKFNGTSWGAVTDAAGHFLIEDVNPGKYRFFAERNGYVRLDYLAKGPGKTGIQLTLTKGQKVKGVAFKLTPHGVVSGKVVDEDGEPLANVQIELLGTNYRNGTKGLQAIGTAGSDDRGEYRVFGVAPGKYCVRATYDRGANMVQQVEIRKEGPQDGYLPTFYPNVTSSTQASRVEVTAGAEASGIDFRLTPVHTAHISGKITNPAAGTRFAMVSLMASDDGFAGGSFKHSLADDKGNFMIRGVAPGSYTLTAQSFVVGGSDRQIAATAVEVGDSNVDGVQLTFGAASEISGVIALEKAVDPKGLTLYVNLSYEDAVMSVGNPSDQVREDGRFKLKVLMPARYRLNVYPLPEQYYVKSIRYGDTESPNGVLDLSRGVTGAVLTVTIAADSVQIDGKVQDADDKSAAGATVVLIPEQRDFHSLYKVGNTDQDGHFTIKGVKPGKYKLFAFDQVEWGQYEDSDFIEPFEDKGEEVEVHGSDKVTKDLKLIVAGDASDN